MTQSMIGQLLAVSLGLIMFGMGLSLDSGDFARVLRYPRAITLALLLQVVVMPTICYGLIILLDVPPLYAVGMMLVAASPGGVTANVFSHLFGGNVALNISLTAANTLLSLVTLPIISNWAIARFLQTDEVIPFQITKVMEVICLILVPVLLGMLVRRRSLRFADRSQRAVKIFSALVLAVMTTGAIFKEWSAIASSISTLALAIVSFNFLSMTVGYWLPRIIGLDRKSSIAICFEVGVHNATLAIVIALTVLHSMPLAVPAAIYTICMYITAPVFGLIFQRSARSTAGVDTKNENHHFTPAKEYLS